MNNLIDLTMIDPVMTVDENQVGDLGGKKQFKAIINYKVIEKSRDYVVLRVNYIQMKDSRRKI